MKTDKLKSMINGGELDGLFTQLYNTADVRERYIELIDTYDGYFDNNDVELYSAGGRVEVVGNHTDHNGGCVLTAAINLDSLCVAAPNGTDTVTLYSKGFDGCFKVDLTSLEPRKDEINTTEALIRGCASGVVARGMKIGGFDAYLDSKVPRGAGLSSSASIETLLVSMFAHMFNNAELSAIEVAKISQAAEREYFGKPCGLMDQAACASGGLLTIDFREEPIVKKLDVDFDGDILLAVVETGGSHADLTGEYAAITEEMRDVAEMFGEKRLREVDEAAFYSALHDVQSKAGDRAVLRAMHFFDENKRVLEASKSLEQGDYDGFFACVNSSGDSSWKLLQNCYVAGTTAQQVPLAVALAKRLIGDNGACRVHGGGFGGTILAFVPREKKQVFTEGMSSVFGKEAVHFLAVRRTPACHLEI